MLMEESQDEITKRLWSIVTELCSINEYEYPYRIPRLQKRADAIFADVGEMLERDKFEAVEDY
jgi:hypothetical protein